MVILNSDELFPKVMDIEIDYKIKIILFKYDLYLLLIKFDQLLDYRAVLKISSILVSIKCLMHDEYKVKNTSFFVQ